MNIGLLAVDSNYPNLALMKISAYHKRLGDKVDWYNPFDHYDKLYMAKVFSFTPDYRQYITNADAIEKGGTGYDISKRLPIEIDRMQPDYSIYPQIDSKTAYGFLTRGCPNKCKWCVVPKKEGSIAPYMDIEEIAVNGRKNIVLMDNNVLASDYGLEQIAEVERAALLIDKYGYKGEYFLYCILMDFKESFSRINYWKNVSPRFIPHAQPYRDLNNPRQNIPQWQKDMAHWADRKELYRSCEFKDFSPRKGFKCSEYFNVKKYRNEPAK